MKKTVALIGPNESQCSDKISEFAEALGKALAEEGYILVSGGLGGFMEAVFKGAKRSSNSEEVQTIGIIPGDDKTTANQWCDVVIPTGIGIARNLLVVSTGDAVVAVGGGAGTLSEIALAWQMGKKVICVEGLEGWSEKLAGKSLDSRRRDTLIPVKTTNQILTTLKKWLK
jgi:uncharacterized protein (TIGR00725 family)